MQLLPAVKEALGLLEKKKKRVQEKKFTVEGVHLVAEAGSDIEYLLYSEKLPIVAKIEQKRIPAFKVSKKTFELLTSVESPQGVLAVVRKKERRIEDILKISNSLLVYCVEIQDPGNLGTIIRSADAAGATGVLLSKGTVELYNQKVIRSTMGSIFHLPIIELEEDGLEILKRNNIKLVAADVSGRKNYWQADMSGNAAVVIGNEGAGLPDSILKSCDETVNIPMPGKAESLNAAMSATLILYEALRQRWKE